jgi:transcriptional regulator with XRE-family HTH domain
MTTHTTLSDRIHQILRETGRKQNQLADDAGVSKGLVSQWIKEQVQSINLEAARSIARVHGYNPAWVMRGELPIKGPDTTFNSPPRNADLNRLMMELEDIESLGPQWAELAQAITTLVKRLKDAQKLARHEHLTPEMRSIVEKLCAIDRKKDEDREHTIKQVSHLLAERRARVQTKKKEAS